MTTENQQFYRLDEIDKKHSIYNMIIGERSNGKTFAVLERILKRYLEHKGTGAIIRRWEDDYKRGRGQQMFEGVVAAGKLAGTGWDNIVYRSGKWYLSKWDEDLQKTVEDENPFCYAFALTTMEHDKSTSYSDVTTILFDEFLTRKAYLPDEFVLFMNTVSTIIRYRDNVTIYMCANTVNKTAPYFAEMGIRHIDKMQQGTIDVYEYGDSGLTLSVEYCKTSPVKKKSNKYFAFDNPKLQMITGGAWEMNVYPHLPMKYAPKDVKTEYFILWENDILHCEIIKISKITFTFIHRKTTPIKDEDNDLIFAVKPDPRRNWRRRISAPTDDKTRRIWRYFQEDKVYYQDNEVGEIVRNYLQFCQTYSIIKA